MNLKAIEILTDKRDRLLILDEAQNPLVLSAEVAGMYKSKVIAIYIPGYVHPPKSSLQLPLKNNSYE
jgi:hypothetical protein